MKSLTVHVSWNIITEYFKCEQASDFHTPYLNNRNRHSGGTAIHAPMNLAVKRVRNMELEGELWVWAKTNSVITVEYLKILIISPSVPLCSSVEI